MLISWDLQSYVMIVMSTTIIVKVKLDEYNGTEMVNEEESRREPTFVFW